MKEKRIEKMILCGLIMAGMGLVAYEEAEASSRARSATRAASSRGGSGARSVGQRAAKRSDGSSSASSCNAGLAPGVTLDVCGNVSTQYGWTATTDCDDECGKNPVSGNLCLACKQLGYTFGVASASGSTDVNSAAMQTCVANAESCIQSICYDTSSDGIKKLKKECYALAKDTEGIKARIQSGSASGCVEAKNAKCSSNLTYMASQVASKLDEEVAKNPIVTEACKVASAKLTLANMCWEKVGTQLDSNDFISQLFTGNNLRTKLNAACSGRTGIQIFGGETYDYTGSDVADTFYKAVDSGNLLTGIMSFANSVGTGNLSGVNANKVKQRWQDTTNTYIREFNTACKQSMPTSNVSYDESADNKSVMGQGIQAGLNTLVTGQVNKAMAGKQFADRCSANSPWAIYETNDKAVFDAGNLAKAAFTGCSNGCAGGKYDNATFNCLKLNDGTTPVAAAPAAAGVPQPAVGGSSESTSAIQVTETTPVAAAVVAAPATAASVPASTIDDCSKYVISVSDSNSNYHNNDACYIGYCREISYSVFNSRFKTAPAMWDGVAPTGRCIGAKGTVRTWQMSDSIGMIGTCTETQKSYRMPECSGTGYYMNATTCIANKPEGCALWKVKDDIFCYGRVGHVPDGVSDKAQKICNV